MAQIEAAALASEDLRPTLARLDGWLTSLGDGLASARLSATGLREDSLLARRAGAVNAAAKACVSEWPLQREALRPAEALAQRLDHAVVLLVFGKFNAGKSSLCNLVADRFAARGKAVAYFHLDGERLVEDTDRFAEGATETTTRLQGVRLGDRLVLLDTPGLHSATAEHAALTHRFADSADAILWFTNATAPGQVQELDALSAELRRSIPLLPVLTRSDQYEEDAIDGTLVKHLCNKSEPDRARQEADVADRTRSKLAGLGLDVAQLKPPVSVSAHMARARESSPATMAAAGMERLYAALRTLVEPALAYRRRKHAEVLLRHLDETVLGHLRHQLLPVLTELKMDLEAAAKQIEARCAQFQDEVWRAVVPLLPGLLDAHAPTRDADAVCRAVSQALDSAFRMAADVHLSDYRLAPHAPSRALSPGETGFKDLVIVMDGRRQSICVDATRLHAALERQICDEVRRSADAAQAHCAASIRDLMAGAARLAAVLETHQHALNGIRADLRAGGQESEPPARPAGNRAGGMRP